MNSGRLQLCRSNTCAPVWAKYALAIIGSTAIEMVDRASEAMRDSPFLEFRLDYLEKTARGATQTEAVSLPTIRSLPAIRPPAAGPLTGENSRAPFPPNWRSYRKPRASGFHLMDLELQTAGGHPGV